MVADEAAALLALEPGAKPVIDITGIELSPGDPQNCLGNGKEDPMTYCCDECDYYLECFPDTIPGDPM